MVGSVLSPTLIFYVYQLGGTIDQYVRSLLLVWFGFQTTGRVGRVRAAGVRVRAVLLRLRLRLVPTMDVAYKDNNLVFFLSCILTSETQIFVHL